MTSIWKSGAGAQRPVAWRAMAVALGALVLTAGVANGARADSASSSTDYASSYEVVVGVSKSQVVQLPGAYSDVMVADPKVADVLPLNGHAVYLVGKEKGATAVTIYGPGKRLLAALNVVVSPDLESFKARLHEIMPAETDVAVRPANDSIVLSGTVSSPSALEQILKLAESYAPGKVVNMMGVEGTQQVMLSVRFAEMERTTAKDLRLNVQTPAGKNGKFPFQLTTGDSIVNPSSITALKSFGLSQALIGTGAGDLTLLFDALETKGLVKTLAEPNLVAMSGDTASFLAGGEFPVPIASSSGATNGSVPTITVEFKQFGVALAFTPTILKDGLINLVVNPEVSDIDPTVSVNTGIVSVPGLKVRRAHTTVELRDGESFTIAGLLKDNYQNSIRQYPFIGDLPILGALFRSTGYQRDETELVIVVTPHLVMPRRASSTVPTDHFVPPSDFELFLMGAQNGAGQNLSPADRALLSADPTKGGVDGPHGHVLY